VAQRDNTANLADAGSTVLVRIVTQSRQAAGICAVGWFAVLVSLAAWRPRGERTHCRAG
jgi:hypothetical protein